MDIEEVINWLMIMKANLNSFPEVSNAKKIEALAEAIRLLKNEQSEEPRWIPISERLPQENERVLVTIQTPHRTSVRSGIFFYPFFSIDNGDCWRFNEEEVVAWMSLPKPYREVEE
jgi:hypothetical protein